MGVFKNWIRKNERKVRVTTLGSFFILGGVFLYFLFFLYFLDLILGHGVL